LLGCSGLSVVPCRVVPCRFVSFRAASFRSAVPQLKKAAEQAALELAGEVRNATFCDAICTYNASFYQDRLGTKHLGERALKKR
jgi:hypothetical protein